MMFPKNVCAGIFWLYVLSIRDGNLSVLLDGKMKGEGSHKPVLIKMTDTFLSIYTGARFAMIVTNFNERFISIHLQPVVVVRVLTHQHEF